MRNELAELESSQIDKAEKKHSLLPTILLASGVVLFDQLSKWWIVQSFRPGEVLTVIPGFLNLTLVRNTGAAFGFLAGAQGNWRQIFFVSVAVIALVGIGIALRYYRTKEKGFLLSLGGIAGGAVGNLIDRIRVGSVVDFLDCYIGCFPNLSHWPAFNVADSAITVGVGFFLLMSIKYPES